MTTQLTPEAFVAKWRGNTSTERQVYQQHFLDLCALVDHPTPAAVDATNQFFTFEAGAAKLSGGQGWADVWYKGHFASEYKGPAAAGTSQARSTKTKILRSENRQCRWKPGRSTRTNSLSRTAKTGWGNHAGGDRGSTLRQKIGLG